MPHSTSTSRFDGPGCSDIKIVLVDDDPLFRTSLAGLLRDDGHELLDFDRPGALPALAALMGVTLLVTDYEMPDQNGLELADAFRVAHPDAPVILTSGLDGAFLRAEAKRRDFVHALFKPFDYDELHALIHRLAD